MGNDRFPCALGALFLWILCLLAAKCEAKLAPALYIFGDSTLDAGNNNFLRTKAKANHLPYGIDHPLGTTGRFTNGRTTADFYAEWLGLRYQPPAMAIEKHQANQTFEGLNYASGSSGILDSTGAAHGKILCLKKQIELFKKNVEHYLPLRFKDGRRLAKRLSKSIFFFSIGTNDYFLYPNRTYLLQNFEKFTDHLLSVFANNLKQLYDMGARKFVVSELYPFGCSFTINVVDEAAQKLTKSECGNPENDLARVYNSKLEHKLNELSSTLKGSTFVITRVFHLVSDLLTNPSRYGIKDTKEPCVVLAESWKVLFLCQDRNSYALFDQVHPTEAVYKIIASQCFNDTSICVPLNIQQLADKK